MRFGVLGPLAVWAEDGTSIAIPGTKVRALLADLLIADGRPVSADRLIDDLWGKETPANPAGALQAKVSQLRRALEEAEPGGRALVAYRAPGYRLRVESEAVDAGRFESLAARARTAREPAATAALLADALALWRGPAYADFADDAFARAATTRLEEQRVAALEEYAEVRLALGEHGPLVAELGDLIARYPLRERLYAVHMRALYRAGRQADALASYGRLRDRLRDELGLDPGHDLVRLHQAILEQDPTLDAATDPPSAAQRPRTNLPTPLAGLIGRTGAIADVRDLLATERLVTLTGPGGVGKTRLAVETARQLVDTTPDGTWMVELAALDQTCCENTVDSLAEVVAATLGVRDDATLALALAGERADLTDRLAEALRAKRLLLVLDNCEHVVEPVAKLADQLLRSAPGLHVLATSREPLGLTGETVWPVAPLEPPDQTTEATPPILERSTAVQLFVARAAAAAPGFSLNPDTGPAVATICRRLDGLPLALELAATRVRALGVRELADRLDDRFRLLATGHRDAPARQQTLRAMVDWSWELLSERERAVLRRLAVHADGCTLAAAEIVCGGDDVGPADVLDLLARLVDRSLVVVTDSSGGTRYRLLESVAAYCLERLDEAGETIPTRHRHACYYTDLAEHSEARLRGHGQREWLERLDLETTNLRVALDWAVQQHATVLALRLVNAMAWYWFLRGRHREGHRSLTRALATDDGKAPVAARARALAWLSGIGFLERPGNDPAAPSRNALELYDRVEDPGARAHAQWILGFAMSGSVEMSAGEPLVNDALQTFRRLGDRWGVAAALSVRTSQSLLRGELAAARRQGEESRALFREVGDRWGQSRTADLLGVLAEIAGDYEQAARLHREGLRMAEELGLWPVASQLLARLGRLALLSADYPAAEELHERALRLAREQSFAPGVTFAEVGLGLVARRRGRLERAEAHLRSVLEWHSKAGYEHGRALTLAELGFVAEQRGDAAAARALHLDGLTSARATGDPRAVALALEGLAGADNLAGHHRPAARRLGAAAAARESVDSPLPSAERGDVDRITEAVRVSLGEANFAAEYHHGRNIALDQMLAT